MKKVSITFPEQTGVWFSDIAKAFYKSFLELGYSAEEVEITRCETIDGYDRAELCIIFGAHWFVEQGLEREIEKPDGVKWAWYQLEQLPYVDQSSSITLGRWNQMIKIVKKFDHVVVESPAKKEWLEKQGVTCGIINCGYHEIYDQRKKIPEEILANEIRNKDYDVFFYGAITPRRKSIIEELLNRKVRIYPIGGFLIGRERFFAIQNSKLVLNIHMNDVEYFEKPRIICDCLSNRGFVVTERLAHPEEFVSATPTTPGCFISAPYDELVDTVEQWISEDMEEQRVAIAQAGYDFVRQEENLLITSLEKWVSEVT